MHTISLSSGADLISLLFHILGLLIPPITVELGGHVVIDCEKTGYRTEMDFKLKVRANSSASNVLLECAS